MQIAVCSARLLLVKMDGKINSTCHGVGVVGVRGPRCVGGVEDEGPVGRSAAAEEGGGPGSCLG